ncbi:MAG: putative Na+/H+ antiporter, partial [Puniceicoccales bacterium]|nr:putative Na+/H+ antiporter [Puniceicoccales bacterium]
MRTFGRLTIFLMLCWSGGAFAHGLCHSATANGVTESVELAIGDGESPLPSKFSVSPREVATAFFFFTAIVHTFCAGAIGRQASQFQKRCDSLPISARLQRSLLGFYAHLCHLLGEIELPFAIWAIPSLLAICWAEGIDALRHYLCDEVSFSEPIFIVVIMAMAATRPVLSLAEKIIGVFAGLGRGTAAAWWFAILLVAPPLGSFLTEPAAITIGALLL